MKLGNVEYIPKHVIEYSKQGVKNKILSETVEFVPRVDSNKLSETVYKQVFYNGKVSPELKTRSIYFDKNFGTKTVYKKYFPENPNAESKKVEITNRSLDIDKSYGYGYNNGKMKTTSSYKLSKDGSYIEREEHVDIGAINDPNCYLSRVDEFKPNCHLHYINGQLYKTTPPVFYKTIPNTIR